MSKNQTQSNSKLKILIINYEHYPVGGGGGVMTKRMSKELAARGHLVHVLTSGYKDLPKHSIEDGAEIFRVPVLGRTDLSTGSALSLFTFPLSSIPKALQLARKYKYDIINTHFYAPTGPTGAITSLLTGIPNSLFIHAADVYDPTRIDKTPAGKGLIPALLRISARWQSKIAANIACQSSNTKENIEKYIQTHKPVKIIPLPFEPMGEIHSTRKDLGLRKDRFYLCYLGRVVERKGLKYLVEAMSLVDKNIYLNLLGDGPELENLKAQAKQLGVSDRIAFTGYLSEHNDNFKYHKASDVFILPSLHEGMGIVIQEAMELGMPVITTNHGGQVDLIKDGINGLLVDPASPKQLASAIEKLYKNADLRRKMGQQNKKDIKKYYVGPITSRLLDFFKQAIESKKKQ